MYIKLKVKIINFSAPKNFSKIEDIITMSNDFSPYYLINIIKLLYNNI